MSDAVKSGTVRSDPLRSDPLRSDPLRSDADPHAPRRLPRSLGMFLVGMESGRNMYGRGVAIRDFNTALWRYSAIERIDLFEPPLSGPRRPPARGAESRLAVHRLADALDTVAPEIWHDVTGDVVRPFRLRDGRSDRAQWFPITVTHHTISYQWMVHALYLPLVLDMTADDALVCTSRAARAAIARILDHVSEQLARRVGVPVPFRGRLEVIPLGIDTELFAPRDRADARRQLGLPRDGLIVLWNGRISFFDKTDLLPTVKVFRDLVASNPSTRLSFVLAGAERPHEQAHAAIRDYARQLGIAESVRVLGDLDPRLRQLLYASADVFVSPVDNVQETFGITPLEAMACGVPQVVSDWDGYRDTVVDGETGFLVRTLWTKCDEDLERAYPILDSNLFDHLIGSQTVVVDPQAFLHVLQLLVRDAALRARMSEASRRRAVACFEWARVIGQYESLWAELVAARAMPSSAAVAAAAAPAARWELPHFEAFQGYASTILPATTLVGITASGCQLLEGREPPPPWPLRRELIDMTLGRQALERLAGNGGLGLADLADHLSRETGTTAARARRHVMWLMKYGFAAPVSATDRAAPASDRL